MARININIDGVNSANLRLRSSGNTINTVRLSVNSVRNQIDTRIKGRRDINNRLNNLVSSIERTALRLNRITTFAANSAQSYRSTDDLLAGRRIGRGVGVKGPFTPGLKPGNLLRGQYLNLVGAKKGSSASFLERFFTGKIKAKGEVSYKTFSNEDGLWKTSRNFLNLEGEASFGPKYGKYEDDAFFYEKKPKNHKDNRLYAYDRETGQLIFPDMVEYAEKKGTIAEISAAASVGASIYKAEASIEGSAGKVSVAAKVAAAEAHAGISAGLYVFDKDGNKKLAPAVDAKIGASFSLLQVEADGLLGSKNLGLYGKGEASAGKVEAKATGTVSVFNEDGSLNLQARATASAKAIAVEAKGSAGITVLGSEVGVTGSVNIGVGAHADIGIVDGKVKVDIGASLGVGVSVGFEVDVAGTVNAVAGAAKSAWGKLGSLF